MLLCLNNLGGSLDPSLSRMKGACRRQLAWDHDICQSHIMCKMQPLQSKYALGRDLLGQRNFSWLGVRMLCDMTTAATEIICGSVGIYEDFCISTSRKVVSKRKITLTGRFAMCLPREDWLSSGCTMQHPVSIMVWIGEVAQNSAMDSPSDSRSDYGKPPWKTPPPKVISAYRAGTKVLLALPLWDYRELPMCLCLLVSEH